MWGIWKSTTTCFKSDKSVIISFRAAFELCMKTQRTSKPDSKLGQQYTVCGHIRRHPIDLEAWIIFGPNSTHEPITT